MEKKERTVVLPEGLFTQIFALIASLPSNIGSKVYVALEPYGVEVAENQKKDLEEQDKNKE